MRRLPIPAFSYLYIGRGYPARGMAAWALLEEHGRKFRRRDVVLFLSDRFQITPTAIRVLLHQGHKIFWRIRGKYLYLKDAKQLWKRVRNKSVVHRQQFIAIPEHAFLSIHNMRAYFAQAALSRGERKPISRQSSAQMLGRGQRAITSWKRYLKEEGILQIVPQYQRLRTSATLSLQNFQPLAPEEFIKGDEVFRRLPDVVIILTGDGKPVVWLSKNPSNRAQHPRRYFDSMRQLESWKGKVSAAPLLRSDKGWELITKVFRSEYIRYRTDNEGLSTSRGKLSSAGGFTQSSGRSRISRLTGDAGRRQTSAI